MAKRKRKGFRGLAGTPKEHAAEARYASEVLSNLISTGEKAIGRKDCAGALRILEEANRIAGVMEAEQSWTGRRRVGRGHAREATDVLSRKYRETCSCKRKGG